MVFGAMLLTGNGLKGPKQQQQQHQQEPQQQQQQSQQQQQEQKKPAPIKSSSKEQETQPIAAGYYALGIRIPKSPSFHSGLDQLADDELDDQVQDQQQEQQQTGSRFRFSSVEELKAKFEGGKRPSHRQRQQQEEQPDPEHPPHPPHHRPRPPAPIRRPRPCPRFHRRPHPR